MVVDVDADEMADRLGSERTIVLFWTPGSETSERFYRVCADRSGDADTAFLAVEAAEDDEAVRRYGIPQLPALVVFEGGEIAHRMAGRLDETHLDVLLVDVDEGGG